jgi:chromosomal replication initiation ATPase DnaA
MAPDHTDDTLPDARQLILDLGHRPSLGAEDFLVEDGNRLAFAHIMAFPAWTSPLTLLVGPPKSGKSHLARIWATLSGAVDVGSANAATLARSAGSTPLLVEDVDRTRYAEPALFHLLNHSMRAGRPLLMTARTLVPAWPYRTDDVRSRARLASLFTLAPFDDTLLSQILVKLFADRQLAVDPKVIAFLAARMERSPEEAVILVGIIDKLSLSRRSAVTRSIAAEALAIRQVRPGGAQLQLELDGD